MLRIIGVPPLILEAPTGTVTCQSDPDLLKVISAGEFEKRVNVE